MASAAGKGRTLAHREFEPGDRRRARDPRRLGEIEHTELGTHVGGEATGARVVDARLRDGPRAIRTAAEEVPRRLDEAGVDERRHHVDRTDVGAADQGAGHAVLGQQGEQLAGGEVAAVVDPQQRPGVERLDRRHAGGGVDVHDERHVGRPGGVRAGSRDAARLAHRVVHGNDHHAGLRRVGPDGAEHAGPELGDLRQQLERHVAVGARDRPRHSAVRCRREHADDTDAIAGAGRALDERPLEVDGGEARAEGGVADGQHGLARPVDALWEQRVRRAVEAQRQRSAVRRPHRRSVGTSVRGVRRRRERQAGPAGAVEVDVRRREDDPAPEVDPRHRRRHRRARRGRDASGVACRRGRGRRRRRRRRRRRGRRRHGRHDGRGVGRHDRRLVGAGHDDHTDDGRGGGEHGGPDEPAAAAAGVEVVEADVAEGGERGLGGRRGRRRVAKAGAGLGQAGLEIVHDVASFRVSSSCRANVARALDRCVLTVPSEQPSTAATSATGRSST